MRRHVFPQPPSPTTTNFLEYEGVCEKVVMAVSSETPVEEKVLMVPLLPLVLCCRVGFLLGDLEMLKRERLSPATGFRRDALKELSKAGSAIFDTRRIDVGYNALAGQYASIGCWNVECSSDTCVERM